MFSQRDLLQLVEPHEPPCVSLYMPTHPAGREQQQDDVRHKNLLQQAAEQLAQQEMEVRVRQEVLDKLENIPHDDRVWRHRSHGLAAFSAPDYFRCYTLPWQVPEWSVVSGEFHVGPLLPMLHENSRFFILALTKDSANLYEATRHSLVNCELPDLSPLEVDGAEQALQYHSHRAPSQGKGKAGEAMFHGHGAPNDREKGDIENFFKRQVEPAVSEILQGQRSPMVLACVDYLVAIYREANTYQHLVEGHVSGSPDQFDEQTLREQAWLLMEPVVRQVESAAKDRFGDLSASDRTTTEADKILQAAHQGRIETLFVTQSNTAEVGAERPEDGPPQQHLIEQAAQQTLLTSGQVLAVEEVPGGGPLAAILRY